MYDHDIFLHILNFTISLKVKMSEQKNIHSLSQAIRLAQKMDVCKAVETYPFGLNTKALKKENMIAEDMPALVILKIPVKIPTQPVLSNSSSAP